MGQRTGQAEVFQAGLLARREIIGRARRLFIGGVGLMAIGAIVAAVTLASEPEIVPPTTYIGGAAVCAGFAGLMMGISTLFQLRQPRHVEVTDHRLIWREGPKVATMEFDEVERVELVRDTKRVSGMMMEFPVVRFIENDDEIVEFEVTFEDRGMLLQARFDAQGITEAILPHIRNHAVISPDVDEFVKTGMVDLDALHDR